MDSVHGDHDHGRNTQQAYNAGNTAIYGIEMEAVVLMRPRINIRRVNTMPR